MLILFKVMKSDCTTLLGLVVRVDYKNFVYIPKSDIHNYTYSNAKFDKRGYLHPTNGASFVRGNGGIIISSEWNEICRRNPKNLEELKLVCHDILKNSW